MYHFFRVPSLLFIYLLLFFYTEATAQKSIYPQLKHTQELSQQYPDSAFLMLKKMHTKAIENNDQVAIGMCLQQMGKVCYNLGHYAQSLEYHQQAEKVYQLQNNKNLLADNFNDMGILYYYNRQKTMARKQYNQALNLYRSVNNKEGLAETFGNLGHLFEKEQRYDSAFYYQEQALAQYRKIEHKHGMAKIYENLGSIYEDLARYDSSFAYFNRSLNLYEKSNDQLASIEVINNLGDIYRKTGRYKEGMVYSRQALTLATKTNNLYQRAAAYRDIAKTFNLLGRNDSAYHYLELNRHTLLDIYSDQNNKQMSFLRAIYEMDKKSDEIERLESSHKINMIITVSIIIVIVLLVVLGMVVISRQRLKIREAKAIAEHNTHIYEAQKGLMQVELKNKQLEEDVLKQELELKSKELTTHTLNVIQNNQFLENLRNKIQEMVKDDKRDQKKALQQIIQQINHSIDHDQQWKEFAGVFEQVHQSFFDNLKKHCDDLTANDMRLVALLKMNLSSKDMAVLLGISQDSLRVARYRLRKKLNIDQGDNLSSFIQTL